MRKIRQNRNFRTIDEFIAERSYKDKLEWANIRVKVFGEVLWAYKNKFKDCICECSKRDLILEDETRLTEWITEL